ncbi:MAG: hypothetical protein ACREMQ_03935 [Longimicrobiales bacterium]
MVARVLARAALVAGMVASLPTALAGQNPPASSEPRSRENPPGSALRIASGTSWQPDATTPAAIHTMVGAWQLMLHGSMAVGYVREETPRGGDRFGSSNWAMLGATRSLGAGALSVTAMGSLETLTLGECGYPRLLSNGARCAGNVVGEFQYPHAPIMELAARYARPIDDRVALELFAALVGEPALGPPSHVHRASAAIDPLAPISHHDMNPAHGSAGVLTAGLSTALWKLEVSAFDGERSDPDRFLPDPGPLKSFALRLSVNPSPLWSMQGSVGRIPSATGHHAGASGDLRVTTASVSHVRPVGGTGEWAATAGWVRMDDGPTPRHSFLLESALRLGERYTFFGRAEAADRPDDRITIIDLPNGAHEHIVETRRASVAQVSGGLLLGQPIGSATVGVGARASLSFVPEAFVGYYLERRATGFAVFGWVRPRASKISHQH